MRRLERRGIDIISTRVTLPFRNRIREELPIILQESSSKLWGPVHLVYFVDGAAFWKEAAVARIPSA